MKIFIYKLSDLDEISNFFETLSPEMDMFDFFIGKLKSNYEIVDELDKADIAFIPIDFIKLIYGQVKYNQWHDAYTKMSNFCGQHNLIPKSQPPTIGIGDKEKYIKFFWDFYVKNKINLNSKVPHFILYSYVLFEVSFEYIDESVFILTYEDKVSIFNSPNTFDIGTKNRTIPIPYIQNLNINYNLPRIYKHIKTIKEINFSFIGTLSDEHRPVLTSSRSFILNLKSEVYLSNFYNVIDTLYKTKYLFVLRGDTPSRINFYQCFAYDVVPIIFESEIQIYSKIICDKVYIINSCLILPNKNNQDDKEYAELVDSILVDELSNEENYMNRVKNHKHIFSQINYFTKNCIPIQNVLKQIKLNGTR